MKGRDLMSGYRIVSPEEADEVRAFYTSGRQMSGGTAALLAGEMVYVPHQRTAFNSTEIRRRHGVRLRTLIHGDGRYWWVEPIE
jgi:hypothetical protein